MWDVCGYVKIKVGVCGFVVLCASDFVKVGIFLVCEMVVVMCFIR